MSNAVKAQLQILLANERDVRLDAIEAFLVGLGHTVVARTVDVGDVAALSRERDADIALVGLGLDSDHALKLIDNVVQEAACPVIAILDATDHSYIARAA